MPLSDINLSEINVELRNQSPESIIRWALSLNKKSMMTTSFGINSAVSLHMLSQIDKSVSVVWADSGYNTRDAYTVAEELIYRLELNMHIVNPLVSAERRNAIMGIPNVDDDEFKEFTRQVKLEPFARAIDEVKPKVWLTGIQQGETEFRQGLDIVTVDGRGILKVAPIFYWTPEQVEAYIQEHKLPTCKRYFDPTKVNDNRECGLHTSSI